MAQKRRGRPDSQMNMQPDRREAERRKVQPDRREAERRSVQPDEQEMERRRRQAAKKRAVNRKKRRRRRIIVKCILILLLTVILAGGLGYLSTLLFRLEKIKVTKNQYTASEDVETWIRQDRYSEYTLYTWWKYNHTDPQALPAAESVKVKLTSPQEVTVEVKEKTFTGRMEQNGSFLYFDEEGIASYQSTDVIEGVMLVESTEVDAEDIQIGSVLPVSDKAVFEKLSEIVELLKQNELTPDKIGFDELNVTLSFGGIQVQIGNGDYKIKLQQIPPILTKLNELYPGQSGVLHLENYEQGTDSIRFVPKREEEEPQQPAEQSQQPSEEPEQTTEGTGE